MPQLIAGGFVGVDVFFVLSGFLITGLITRQEAEGRFCLKRFYLARVMRLIPALAAMLAGILAIAWWFLLPHELHELRYGMVHSLADFMRFTVSPKAGYFQGAIEDKPLVHLWSLAVEGQFYLLWPLLLVAVPGRRAKLAALALIIAASFAANLWMVGDVLARAYYLPQSRFWQLAAGGLLALMLERGEGGRSFALRFERFGITTKNAANIASVAGLALIAVAALTFTDRLEYPGWWALVPTLGALLVIVAGPAALLNRAVLACRPMVAMGLVSYALYLWHWPLIAFRNILDLEEDMWVTAICLAAALALAAATYRFIEQPLRTLRLPSRLGSRRSSLR